MTPLPKRKLSTYRGGKRVAAKKLKKLQQYTCPKCENPSTPHRVCKKCGYYKNKAVIITSQESK